jgi:hypothetical protein
LIVVQNEDILGLILKMCKYNGPAVIEDPGDLSIREFVKIRFLEGVNSRDQLRRDECPAAFRVGDLPGA